MSIAHGQKNAFLRLFAQLRPKLRTQANLPADIETLLRSEKRFGSRDRRLYRELFYTALRYLPWVESLPDDELTARVARLCQELPATRPFKEAWSESERFDLPPKETLLPAWFRAECPAAFEEPLLTTLLSRAPLWLRLQNASGCEVEEEFRTLGWQTQLFALLPSAVRLLGEADVTKTRVYEQGLFEVQDLGSQLLLEAALPRPGGRWLDACAGAGGKTLQLASLLGSEASVEATDIRPGALLALAQRAQRAGADFADTGRLLPKAALEPSRPGKKREGWAPIRLVRTPGEGYDGVLVDAPCTGSGTWRRSPHLKWSSSPEAVLRASTLQRKLLARFSGVVRPGGTLLYATCSLCRSENLGVVEHFLSENPGFELWPLAKTFSYPLDKGTLTTWPQLHDSDGLFVARLRRRA